MMSTRANQLRASWRGIVDAASEKTAHVLLRRTLKSLGAAVEGTVVERYPKGGFTLQFEMPLIASEWSEAVFELLAAAQRVGYAWQVMGDIHQGLDMHTNEASVQGVQFLHLQMPAFG